MSDNRAIGVFDSGIGGLTVLEALHARLPGESTIYLGDLARCPYGPRPQSEVRGFALQIGEVLARENIKLLVVACNTATAAAIEDLQREMPVPVVGVIDPGAAAAVQATRSGHIGVVATDGTVASGAYVRAIKQHVPGTRVTQCSASWLVPLIERGALARTTVAAQLQQTLAWIRATDIDTLILGCTHFPLVYELFTAAVGTGVTVLDSAATTAARVAELLDAVDLRSSGMPFHRLLVTGPAEAFAERAQAMFRASPRIETVALASAGC